MADSRYDVLVIGGGITGAGIALDAAARGLSVALVERDDFASGTSGRSTRLVHGGIRYLGQGDVRLVREALRERATLLRLAPHMVLPVPMYLPVGRLRSRAAYRLGLAGYDLLAAGRNVGIHRPVSQEDFRAAVPGLGGRTRGYRYFECQCDDARLTMEVARTAHALGAVGANHARVAGLIGDGRVQGATAVDEPTGERFEIRARVTVNAGGVWADRIRDMGGAGGARLAPSKGVHLVFAPGVVRTSVGVVVPSAAGDGRFVSIIPWEDRVYAGATDTPYSGGLDNPPVDQSDRDYILAAIAKNFPEVTGGDVVATWAGLRPLLRPAGSPRDGSTVDLSRRHAVFEDVPGLFTITGGKLTTYRAMAEDLVNRIAERLGSDARCRTRSIPLGLRGPAADALGQAAAEAARLGLPPGAGTRLVQRYGDDWREAVRMIAQEPSLGDPVADGHPVLRVEVALARSREMAITAADIYVRRTRLMTRDASLSMPAP